MFKKIRTSVNIHCIYQKYYIHFTFCTHVNDLFFLFERLYLTDSSIRIFQNGFLVLYLQMYI